MDISTVGPVLVAVLFVSIAAIVALTVFLRLHPFLSILTSTLFFGLATNLVGWLFGTEEALVPNLAKVMAGGFGGILAYIGLVIIFGTIIGKVLEKTGAAITVAEVVIKYVGPKRPALAMSIIGWIVSIPVFCDSGYVILSSLKKTLARQTKTAVPILSVALATGLYSSHTFVPPTPGPIAAAGNLGIQADGLLWVMLFGSIVSIAAAYAGYLWARHFVPRLLTEVKIEETIDGTASDQEKTNGPSATRALSPLLFPILLMALASIANFPTSGGETVITGAAHDFLTFVGHPTIALFIGVVIAFVALTKGHGEKVLSEWVTEGLKDAAMILMITGAGGALGAVIKATPLAEYLQSLFAGPGDWVGTGGLVILFFIAALLKTAQGSSTAALVITSSMAAPMLPALGLDGVWGPIPIGAVLAVGAIGAGAMVVSHVNDSYFWVVSQFGKMNLSMAYRAQTLATLIQGVTALTIVLLLSLVLL